MPLNLTLLIFNYILPICFYSIVLSVLFYLVFKFLKFPENNFKKALTSGLVIYTGYSLIDLVFSGLLLNKGLSLIHPYPILIALILGTFVIQRVYGLNIKRSFVGLLLATAVLMVLMPLIIYGLLMSVVR